MTVILNLVGAHQFSELFSLYFGFQLFDAAFEKDDINFDILTTGLAVGANFHF